jgi:glycosyltransferase involved in cell wall biosynthesis
MLISVIIPFRDRFHYVKSAIDSIVNQTYSNWELILIDDCSTEIYRPSIIDSRIKLIRNDKNLGPGASRQKGVDIAKGDFICFLDSDDIYLPRFMEEHYKIHEKLDYNLSFTYCLTQWANGKLYKNFDLRFKKILPYLLTNNRPWHTSSLMWNKHYLTNWRIDIRTWEDYQFEFDAAFINNNIGCVSEVLCHINLDEEFGLSQNSEKLSGVIDRLKVLSNMRARNIKASLEFKSILKQNIKLRMRKDIHKLSQLDLPKSEYIAFLNKLHLINNKLHKVILILIYQKPVLSKIIFKFFF